LRQWTPLQVLVPANTPLLAPVSTTWTLYPGYVHSWKIDIPQGHSGLTGVRVVYQGTPIVPFNLTDWLIGDGSSFTVPYEDQVMDRGLIVESYNTDIYAHTFYLYADVDPHIPGEPAPGVFPRQGQALSAANQAAIAQLTAAPDGST
jgi:hypothetical protein